MATHRCDFVDYIAHERSLAQRLSLSAGDGDKPSRGVNRCEQHKDGGGDRGETGRAT
jgi:hypothetical protein